MTRAELWTKPAPLPTRQAAWQAAIAAAQKHAAIGSGWQTQGAEMLAAGEDPDLTAEQALKLLQQGGALIEKGVKIERDARDKLLALYLEEPK
jgi:hypothetical protein